MVRREQLGRDARRVRGKHVQLRVPVEEAVLERAGLRGQVLEQGLLAHAGVSEMAQGVPLNVVHQDAAGVETRGVRRCQMLVAPNVWRHMMHPTEHGGDG